MTRGPSGITLVLGGVRSGKSRFAEKLVEESGLDAVYIATGQAFDSEMKARIDRHQARRGENWQTIEAPLDLTAALKSIAPRNCSVLIDCLTLWVSNLMMKEMDIGDETRRLSAVLAEVKSPVVIVTNEVGMGIVPDNKLAREFRDHAGDLNQEIAAMASQVYLVAAGLPLKLK